MTLAVFKNENVLSALIPTGTGNSGTINLFGQDGRTLNYSIQAVYTVGTFSAAAIATANITISSDPTHPSEFMKTAHGLTTGLKVQATTAGTLAVPLALATDYYVIRVSADYFALATSFANAVAGTRIAITNVGVTSTTLTAVALAGASVTFQGSNDGTNWTDLQAATSITVTGSVLYEKTNVGYQYLKVVKALTAGSVDLSARVCLVGPAA